MTLFTALTLSLAVACGEEGGSSTGGGSTGGSSGGSVQTPVPVEFCIDGKTLTVYRSYAMEFNALLTQGDELLSIEESAVVWSVKDEEIATVSGGVVTGVSVGQTELTAKYTYGETEYTDTVTVTVEELSLYFGNTVERILATTNTYGGKTNAKTTESEIKLSKLVGTELVEITDFTGLTFTSDNEAVAKVVDGKVVSGEQAGTATIAVSDGAATGEFKVEVYTALASKFDLDMLAFAYARGTNAADWGVNARYILVDDIDYEGQIFIPIAAQYGRTVSHRMIGKQWKTILAEGNAYGIAYDDFVKTGLNAAFTTDASASTVFRATLDGNGNTLSNAKLMLDACVTTRVGMAGENDNVVFTTHFLGGLGNGGVIRNLAVENFDVQEAAEAGYAFNSVIEGGLKEVGENTGFVSCSLGPVYKFNCFGLIGGGAGTLENVYLQLVGSMDKTMQACGFQQYIFGNWTGIATITDCVFVDSFTDNDATTDNVASTRSIQVASSGSLTTENLVVISSLQSVGTVFGEWTRKNSAAEFVAAVENGSYSLEGFDQTVWNTETEIPTLK